MDRADPPRRRGGERRGRRRRHRDALSLIRQEIAGRIVFLSIALAFAAALGRAVARALTAGECAACGVAIARGATRPLCRSCALAMPWWRRADGCPLCGMPSDPERTGSEAGWGTAPGRLAGCPACLAAGSPLHRCLAATRHADPVARLIPAFKNPKGPFGPPPGARLLVEHLVEELVDRLLSETRCRPDLVVPIPLHPSRLRRRGFNQSDWIADRIARRLGRPFAPGLLVRIRNTGTQAGRSARERRAQLAASFRVTLRGLGSTAPHDPQLGDERGSPPRPPSARRTIRPLAGLRVALVDDVLTTGSTLEAAAEALLEAGAAEVVALTLSATLPPRRARPGAGTYDPAPHQPRSPAMRASRRIAPNVLVVVLALVLGLGFGFAFAALPDAQAAGEAAKPDPAFRTAMKRFLVAQNIPAQMGEQMTYSAAEQVLQGLASTGIPITEPMQAIVLEEARKDFGQRFGDVEFLADLYSTVYVQHFSAKEIAAIADFWESPVAKKLLAQTPTLNEAFIGKMQEATGPLTEPFQTRVDQRLRAAGMLGNAP